MAKVSLSALLDDLRGKLSGSVFQNTVGGLQLRCRVTPRDKRTAQQQSLRANFAQMSSAWPALTAPQRASWQSSFTLPLSGQDLYISANALNFLASAPAIDSYTGTGLLTAPGLVITTLSPSLMLIRFTNYTATVPDDETVLYFATRPASPGVNFFAPSQYVYLGQRSAGTYILPDEDITTAYTGRYGAPTDGQVIGFRALVINTATGDYSISEYISGQVATP